MVIRYSQMKCATNDLGSLGTEWCADEQMGDWHWRNWRCAMAIFMWIHRDVVLFVAENWMRSEYWLWLERDLTMIMTFISSYLAQIWHFMVKKFKIYCFLILFFVNIINQIPNILFVDDILFCWNMWRNNEPYDSHSQA